MKTIKVKNGEQAYQNWKSTKFVDGNGSFDFKLEEELIKAEPDLVAAPEVTTAPELEAILQVLNSGGLTKLTAIQQKVFQLHVVEGMSLREVAEKLEIKHQGVSKQLKLIQKKLRSLASEYL